MESQELSEDYFLRQVELTVQNVLQDVTSRQQGKQYGESNAIKSNSMTVNVHDLPKSTRESFGIAKHLNQRLQALRRNNDCARCWMQRKHCICSRCPPILLNNSNNDDTVLPNLGRIFLLMHHKEIGMKIDTAKLILAAFPYHCRLVIAGIDSQYQPSMKELEQAIMQQPITLPSDPYGNSSSSSTSHQGEDKDTESITSNKCLVLFPHETAKTFTEIYKDDLNKVEGNRQEHTDNDKIKYDIVVIDGTWAQARKIHSRCLSDPRQNVLRTTSSEEDGENAIIDNDGKDGKAGFNYRNVQLSNEAVEMLQQSESGHQLRRHDIFWRQVGTFEAIRLFLLDVAKETAKENIATTATTTPSTIEKEKGKVDIISTLKSLQSYQQISNQAARIELPPPR